MNKQDVHQLINSHDKELKSEALVLMVKEIRVTEPDLDAEESEPDDSSESGSGLTNK